MRLFYLFLFILLILNFNSCKSNTKQEVINEVEISTPKKEKGISLAKSTTKNDSMSFEAILKEEKKADNIKSKRLKSEESVNIEISKEKVFFLPKEKKKQKNKKKLSKTKILKKGVLHFDSEVFDFGFIDVGEEIDHVFTFINTGNNTINISKATATCGCTTPYYPFIPIEPGDSNKISVHFNSTGRLGSQTATITVMSDANEPVKELTLKGVVRAKLTSYDKDSMISN